MPIGLANIGWRMYMINGSWDIIILILIVRYTSMLFSRGRFQSLTLSNTSQVVYWVETKGKTLEEIDAIFEGEKHSSVPNVELLRQGKEHIDVGEVEQQIVAEVLATKME